MTAHDAITEIRATLDAIPDTPEGMDPMEAVAHMAAKHIDALIEIRRITERVEADTTLDAARAEIQRATDALLDEVAERIPDGQGALFDLPRAKSRSAIAEGH